MSMGATTDENKVRIDALEQRLGELQDEVDRVNRELVEAQLDAWKSRVEELELQVRLASMDARDDVAPLLEILRNRWLDAREQVTRAGSAAGEVLDSFRDTLNEAADDVRSAARSAMSTLRSSSPPSS